MTPPNVTHLILHVFADVCHPSVVRNGPQVSRQAEDKGRYEQDKGHPLVETVKHFFVPVRVEDAHPWMGLDPGPMVVQVVLFFDRPHTLDPAVALDQP